MVASRASLPGHFRSRSAVVDRVVDNSSGGGRTKDYLQDGASSFKTRQPRTALSDRNRTRRHRRDPASTTCTCRITAARHTVILRTPSYRPSPVTDLCCVVLRQASPIRLRRSGGLGPLANSRASRSAATDCDRCAISTPRGIRTHMPCGHRF